MVEWEDSFYRNFTWDEEIAYETSAPIEMSFTSFFKQITSVSVKIKSKSSSIKLKVTTSTQGRTAEVTLDGNYTISDFYEFAFPKPLDSKSFCSYVYQSAHLEETCKITVSTLDPKNLVSWFGALSPANTYLSDSATIDRNFDLFFKVKGRSRLC